MMKQWIIAYSKMGYTNSDIAAFVGCHPAYVRAALNRHKARQAKANGETRHRPIRTLSNGTWDAQQEFVAAFLLQRNKPAAYIADVIGRPVAEVARVVRAT